MLVFCNTVAFCTNKTEGPGCLLILDLTYIFANFLNLHLVSAKLLSQTCLIPTIRMLYHGDAFF